MTILPATRTSNSAIENDDSKSQTGNLDRAGRRRDDRDIPHATALANRNKSNSRRAFRRTNGSPSDSTGDPHLRKRLKESTPTKHNREQQYHHHQHHRPHQHRHLHHHHQQQQQQQAQPQQQQSSQTRDIRGKVGKRTQDINLDGSLDDEGDASVNGSGSSIIPEAGDNPVCETQLATADGDGTDLEDGTGFNSEDEYATALTPVKNQHLTDEEWSARDAYFARSLTKLGYEIKTMNEDGACLFRALADQIYGDQELHYMVRSSCMDYIVKNKDFFEAYVTEDFDKYIARKRIWNVHGNHLEIQALSEMYNRTIEVYCYEIKPINIFNGGPRISSDEPIRLSYHRMCHYNSISNPNNPSVGVGLGLPSYHTADLDRRRIVDAVRASEELLIEQTMLEDKIKATDWEATNEALEEEVARESYIQYFRDAEKRLKCEDDEGSTAFPGGSSSTHRSLSPRANSSCPNGPAVTVTTSPSSTVAFPLLSVCASKPAALTMSSIPPSASSSSPSSSSAVFPSSSSYSYPSSSSHSYPSSSSCSSVPQQYHLATYQRRRQPTLLSETYMDNPRLSDDIVSLSGPHPTKTTTAVDLISDEEWDDGIMAQVLAESRNTYLDDLKRNSKRRIGSPGPSTST